MVLQEVHWLRSHRAKLCPMLKRAALDWYRLNRHYPCFLLKPFRILKQRFHKIPVIVQVEDTRDPASIYSIAALANCQVIRELPLINGFATKVNAKSLEKLVQSVHVKRVSYDREVRAVLDVASSAIGSAALWETGLTGKGIVVAVLDTGIYPHPDLAGRIVGFKDFVKHKSVPYDDNGHGTHVAGDIAANGRESEFRYRAPAPEAALVGVKVLDKMGIGSLSRVIEGIQWCIENKEVYGIKVLNLSLGSEAADSYVNDPVCQAVEKAWQAGIVVCAAAGNSGPEAGTINSPGIDPVVITVGALDDRNTTSLEGSLVADFSSRGPTIDGLVKPDLLSPGVNIISLRSPGSKLDKTNKQSRVNKWYASLSGTSMATPVCAGAVAQLLQSNPALTPDQVKARLVESAIKLEDLAPNVQGAGILHVPGAAALQEGSKVI
ncbi:MAG: S8 family peptidase [Bacillota bacterium]